MIEVQPPVIENQTNTLFPVFLKLEQMQLLIVGGGSVGLEKLRAVLNNSPKTAIKLIAISISDEINELAKENANVELIRRAIDENDLSTPDLIIVAVNDRSVSEWVHSTAKANGKLVNVADKPDLCDFYLSSVVTKGNLKVAISTNGKSPTVAKRLKEVFANAYFASNKELEAISQLITENAKTHEYVAKNMIEIVRDIKSTTKPDIKKITNLLNELKFAQLAYEKSFEESSEKIDFVENMMMVWKSNLELSKLFANYIYTHNPNKISNETFSVLSAVKNLLNKNMAQFRDPLDTLYQNQEEALALFNSMKQMKNKAKGIQNSAGNFE